MDMIKLTETQPYVLSLDSLDLQFIERNVRNTNNETIPIWTKHSSETYYKFQVVEQKETATEDIKYEDTSDKFTCHICDILVPKIFRREHFESDKHRMFGKLAEVALTRVTKNLNSYEEIKSGSVPKNIWYCAACCDTVYNKELHNNSKKHLKFTKLDETMKLLLTLYIDKNAAECLNDIDFNLNDRKIIDKNEPVQELKEEKNSIKTEIKEKIETLPLQNEVKFNPPLSKSQVKTSKTDLSGPKKALETNEFYSYLVSLAKKHNLILPKLDVDGDLIIIHSAKGEIHKVTKDNFHGLMRNLNGIFCKLCYEQVEGDISEHDSSEKHVTNIFKPLSEDFTRQISANLHHCVICNKLTSNTAFHRTNDLQHKTILEEKQLVGKSFDQPQRKGVVANSIIETKPNETYCKVCNISLHKNNLNSHKLGQKHKELELLGSLSKSAQITVKNVKSTAFELPDFIIVKDKETYCNICSVTIPYTSKNISEHINASKHKGNLSKFLEENKIVLDGDCYKCLICNNKVGELINHMQSEMHQMYLNHFCFVCNVRVPIKGMEVHERGKAHNDKLQAAGSKTDLASNDSNNVKTISEAKVLGENVIEVKTCLIGQTNNERELLCRLCETIIPNKHDHINEHFEGKKHIKKYNNTLQTNSIKENSNGYKCEICDINKIKDFVAHIQLDSHKTLMMKNNDLLAKLPPVYCNICKKDTTGQKQHDEEFSHTVELYSLLKNNKINENGTTEYSCIICNIFFSKDMLMDHIKSRPHTDKIKHAKKAIQYNYCELCKENVDIEGHDTSLQHRAKEFKIQNDNRIKNSDNHYYCEPCEQIIFKLALLLHIENPKHLKKLKKFNDDIKTEFCDICNDIFKEYNHDKGITHMTKLYDVMKHNKITKSSEHFHCHICEQNINEEDLMNHILSEEHNKAQTKMFS